MVINPRTYIDDRDFQDVLHQLHQSIAGDEGHKEEEEEKEQTNQLIQLNWEGIDVGTLNQQSILSVGNNRQPVWQSFLKGNQGLGVFSGRNVTESAVTFINDQDIMDHIEIKSGIINDHD